MAPYTPVPDPITPSWLTTVLREAGVLTDGQVLTVASHRTGAFNSHTQQLELHYSNDAPPDLARNMILKRNIPEPWAIEAGAEEVKFYQVTAGLHPPPPALVPYYTGAYDAASGNSYLLLQDLSETHAPPVTRDQQVSIVDGVPSAFDIERVVDTLAQHHAYWWNHPLLATETFAIGYWSRDADRFALYLRRRQTAWESLRADEAGWFPSDLRDLYDRVLAHLRQHWERYLEPRFRTHAHITLVHGDAYFANFLCPKHMGGGATYLLDWQSPTVDIAGYDLANLCATFWTSAQRHEAQREQKILERYHTVLRAHGVASYTWEDLLTDYQTGLIYWLLVPVQDRYGGSRKEYWWPKMQCLVAAFREWRCAELLGMAN
jgi:Phosphotransferase enzyme family